MRALKERLFGVHTVFYVVWDAISDATAAAKEIQWRAREIPVAAMA
jgi:hypothetical protein